MSYEQLESVWPVSGSVLIKDGVIFLVAGRSMFLDGGRRRLDELRTGADASVLADDIAQSLLANGAGDDAARAAGAVRPTDPPR